jgi:hypothetical protein
VTEAEYREHQLLRPTLVLTGPDADLIVWCLRSVLEDQKRDGRRLVDPHQAELVSAMIADHACRLRQWYDWRAPLDDSDLPF